MSTITNATVYAGIWNDWSRGRIGGSTLTITTGTASIIIAILALFISQVGSHSWSIICFLTHQLRSTTKPRNGLYHQQQVILRNSVWGSDLGTIYQLGRVAYFWRGHGMRSVRATTWLLLLGFVHMALFFVTGTLSSRIVTIGNEVLIHGPNCGIWNLNSGGPNDLDEQFEYDLHGSKDAQASWQYVQDCVNQAQPAPECNTFKKLRVSFNSTENAPCPFSEEMCNGPPDTSIRFDTGLIDSRDDLGINGMDVDRVQYRRVMTCSPITNQSLITNGTSTLQKQSVNYTAAFYGANYQFPSSSAANGNISNATYVHSNFKILDFVYDELTEPAYEFFTSTAWVGQPEQGFDAIPPLVYPSQGLTIAIVAFIGNYEQPSNDLWLAAHHAIQFQSAGNAHLSNDTKIFRYGFDSQLAVMGCAEQHQYCNPNSKATDGLNCTPLTARPDFNFDGTDTTTNPLYKAVFTTPNQFITLSVLNDAAGVSSIDTWLDRLDVPLLAADQNYVSISTPIADNQWILETTNWFETGMNLLQRMVAEVATGPPGKFSIYTASNSSTVPGLDWFCKNVVVQNSSYVSFSMLALSLIFVIGILLILISLWIESLAHSIQLRFQKGRSFQRRWYLDSTLQLHRMAFESAGLGSWKDGPSEIPLTEKPEEIGVGRSWDMSRISLKSKTVEGIRPVSPASPGLDGIGREVTAKSVRESLLKQQSV